VERSLRQRWSPEQITARLIVDDPDGQEMRVSHETIYQSLYVQSRGALRRGSSRDVCAQGELNGAPVVAFQAQVSC